MNVHLNKVVIITGASSGIGASAAIKFASEGAKVVMVGRNETKLKTVSGKCEKVGHKPLVIAADITEDDSVKRIVDSTLDKYGKLDVLVNNAGILGKRVTLPEKKCVELYDRVLATNLRAAVVLSSLAVPHLIKTKGNIINVSSIAGTNPISINFPYCVSKAGLNHFTKCIAYHLGPMGVRANCVSPGPVITDIIENNIEIEHITRKEQMVLSATKTTVLNRVSEPEEVADVISFVASEAAKCITGLILLADNGACLKGSK